MDKNNYLLKEIDPKIFKISQYLCKEKDYIIEALKCSKCTYILSSPYFCTMCSNNICQYCNDNDSFCPKCNQKSKNGKIQGKLITLLNNSAVQCPNVNQCSEEIKFLDVTNHVTNCKYTKRTAICSGCQKDIQTTNELVEINQHISYCPDICEKCIYCKKDYKRREMQQHHILCDERFVKCIECDEMIVFKEFEVHTRIEAANRIILDYEEKIKKMRIDYEKNIVRRETMHSEMLNEYVLKLMDKNNVD